MSFTFINLPELLNIIHFYSNSILENVLYLLLANLSLNQLLFLKINRVWPGYLNSSRCLSKVSKSTSSQRISVIFQILIRTNNLLYIDRLNCSSFYTFFIGVVCWIAARWLLLVSCFLFKNWLSWFLHLILLWYSYLFNHLLYFFCLQSNDIWYLDYWLTLQSCSFHNWAIAYQYCTH